MDKLLVFIDGSVNPKVRIGYGAYLAIFEHELSHDSLQSKVKLKRFEETSSTKLELQTLLWALSQVNGKNERITVFTDSQNIIRLPGKRDAFVQNDYRSAKNVLLNNHELYREFYQIMDHLDCEFVKVQGHQPSSQKDRFDRLFTLVDRASRKAMKEDCI